MSKGLISNQAQYVVGSDLDQDCLHGYSKVAKVRFSIQYIYRKHLFAKCLNGLFISDIYSKLNYEFSGPKSMGFYIGKNE